MSRIPEILDKRFDQLRQLESAYDLLEVLRADPTDTKCEQDFLAEKISEIEQQLDESAGEVERLINTMKGDYATWTVARLRYMHGFEWEGAANRVGMTAEAAKTRVYRFFGKKKK